jgi:hypothetical protein
MSGRDDEICSDRCKGLSRRCENVESPPPGNGESMLIFVSVVFGWLLASCAGLAFVYRKQLLAAWREPVLRVPVLVFESDDWGYGPDVQAQWLERIADLLVEFTDRNGRHPVMTLGVVLAGPDTERIRASESTAYFRSKLADPLLDRVLSAMVDGAKRGVFAAQLHGMEHYWPPALMKAARTQPAVGHWLTAPGLPATEHLPPPLQSRWMDASTLPSTPLRREDIATAVAEEIREFKHCFGSLPKVVVPPTFAWSAEVQSEWARGGIQVVVSSGQRNPCRDAAGKLVSEDALHFNGATDDDGITFVVRDDYFEPIRGHTHRDGLAALERKTALGRPTLFETHRSNFLGDEHDARNALNEIRLLLAAASQRHPNLTFMSTEELAGSLQRGAALVDHRMRTRVHLLLRRLSTISRLRKLAWLTGAALVIGVALALTRPREVEAA